MYINNKITIDLTDVSEMAKHHFQTLLQDGIDDAESTIADENLRLKGAETEEAKYCHALNIGNLSEYKSILEKALSDVKNITEVE